jgi:hypothetical protein
MPQPSVQWACVGSAGAIRTPDSQPEGETSVGEGVGRLGCWAGVSGRGGKGRDHVCAGPCVCGSWALHGSRRSDGLETDQRPQLGMSEEGFGESRSPVSCVQWRRWTATNGVPQRSATRPCRSLQTCCQDRTSLSLLEWHSSIPFAARSDTSPLSRRSGCLPRAWWRSSWGQMLPLRGVRHSSSRSVARDDRSSWRQQVQPRRLRPLKHHRG